MLDLFDRVSAARPGHRRAPWAFLGGYAVVWTGFGALAFQFDGVVHRTVDTNPWLAQRPWLIAEGPCASAGIPAGTCSSTTGAASLRRSGSGAATGCSALAAAGR